MKSSAPGKIILFGEHAAVYNRPALAVPVTQIHVDVEVLDSSRQGIWIDAPNIDLHAELNSLPADHPIGSAILKVFSTLKISSRRGGTRLWRGSFRRIDSRARIAFVQSAGR